VQQIADKTGAKLCLMTEGANSAGAWLAGAIPHRQVAGEALNHVGYSAHEMLSKPRKVYLLLNVEPELDTANAQQAIQAMKESAFIIALSQFRNAVLEEHADVILPIAPFTETSGTFVNVTGEWQSFKGVAKPYQSSRPAWKVLCVLARFLLLEGFDFESSEAVKSEIKKKIETASPFKPVKFNKPSENTSQSSSAKLMRIGEVPIYAGDSLVRRSQPLQETQTIMEGRLACVRIHPNTAKRYDLQDNQVVRVKQGHESTQLQLSIDNRVAEDAAWIAGGVAELGDLIGEIEIQ
jgi:NADH-quinone oxidoreductase subunit G